MPLRWSCKTVRVEIVERTIKENCKACKRKYTSHFLTKMLKKENSVTERSV